MIRLSAPGRERVLWGLALAMFMAITILHYATNAHLRPYHTIYGSLYFVPVALVAALSGLRGGLLMATATAVVYVPHALMLQAAATVKLLDTLLELATLAATAVAVGALADAQRRLAETLVRAERQAAAGQLAAGLAHEVRNPLGIIKAAAQLLATQLRDRPELARHTQVLTVETDRIDRLIGELLRFAQPRPLAMEPLEATLLTSDLVRACQPLAAQAGVELRGPAQEQALSVLGDSEALRQALLNIILNAIQATPAGGAITVTCGREGAWAAIAVADSGAGIDPALRQRIIDPFFTTRDEGTGLGLATTARIIAEHRGQLAFEANSPHGALVQVKLPLARGPQRP